MRKNKRILIIGKVPPPIGGVTIHVQRLIASLSQIEFKFYNLSEFNPVLFLKEFQKSKIIHLHSSNVYLRFFLSVLILFSNKKLIITYHGNINRYDPWKNFLDLISIKNADIPIVLNQDSFQIAIKRNKNTKLISAFIPPQQITDLPQNTESTILDKKRNYKEVFCTNAFNISFDKNNIEIYQISNLLELFREVSDKALIISDPSGKYGEYFENRGISIPKNVVLISFPHDFNAVIKLSDCMIRYTTTDGDSLSVKESLLLGVPVIATNVVERPSEVILINNCDNELKSIIKRGVKTSKINFNEDASTEIIHLYKTLM